MTKWRCVSLYYIRFVHILFRIVCMKTWWAPGTFKFHQIYSNSAVIVTDWDEHLQWIGFLRESSQEIMDFPMKNEGGSTVSLLPTKPIHWTSNESNTGWWFGSFFIFPYIGNNHPNWLLTNIFQRGWNHQPASTSSSHGESNPSSIKSTGGESDACKGGWNLLRQGSGAVWSVVVSWNGYPKMVGLQWG